MHPAHRVTIGLLPATLLLIVCGAGDVRAQASAADASGDARGHASGDAPGDAIADAIGDYARAVRVRLGLSDAQVAQIRPLMAERNRRLGEIAERYAGKDSRSAKRRKLKEARAAQKEYEQAVEPLLTDEQVAEWKTLRKEMRAELKERWQASTG